MQETHSHTVHTVFNHRRNYSNSTNCCYFYLQVFTRHYRWAVSGADSCLHWIIGAERTDKKGNFRSVHQPVGDRRSHVRIQFRHRSGQVRHFARGTVESIVRSQFCINPGHHNLHNHPVHPVKS